MISVLIEGAIAFGTYNRVYARTMFTILDTLTHPTLITYIPNPSRRASPPQQGHIFHIPLVSSKVIAAENGLSSPSDLPSFLRPLSIIFLDLIAFWC
tara:strand:+ start:3428 stop:3718 length:291 start_codon:yes stop_codon:yes gene_type:complete